MYVCTCLCISVPCECRVCGGQKRMSDALELELQADGSCPVLLLGTKLASSVRVASDLNLNRLSSPSRFYPVCLSVCMSACLCMCRGVCVCVGQRPMSGIIPWKLVSSPPFFLRLSMWLGACVEGWRPQVSSCLCIPSVFLEM